MAWAATTVAHLEINADVGLHYAKLALGLNTHSPTAAVIAALMSHYLGNYQRSIDYLKKIDGDLETLQSIAYTCYALNYYQLGELDSAIVSSRMALDSNPGSVLALRTLTASLAASNQIELARESGIKLIELDASEFIQYFEKYSLYKDSAPLERLCKDLRVAGIPYQRSQIKIEKRALKSRK
jgi:tetratricopeptide (TPR) repeat protein